MSVMRLEGEEGNITVAGPAVEVLQMITRRYLGCRIESIDWRDASLNPNDVNFVSINLTNTDKES